MERIGRAPRRVVFATGDPESANALVSVENSGVEIRGQWDADGATFLVADFLVRNVDGNPVVDGTLVALYPMLTDLADPISYAIRPTRGGSDIMLTDPSADLLTHLNERVWVAGIGDGTGATAFGVISKN